MKRAIYVDRNRGLVVPPYNTRTPFAVVPRLCALEKSRLDVRLLKKSSIVYCIDKLKFCCIIVVLLVERWLRPRVVSIVRVEYPTSLFGELLRT